MIERRERPEVRRRDGQVIRFSREAPEALEQWPGLARFMVDAVNDM